MILNYERPQTTIANNLAVTQSALASRFRAICIGPRYRLNRFGQDTIPAGVAFVAAGQTLNYTYDLAGVVTALPVADVVELASVSLYGVGLEAALASFTDATTDKFYLDAVATPHILNIGAAAVKGVGISAALFTRPVTVGDIVYVSDGVSGVKRRSVIGLQGKAVASSYGANLAKTDTLLGNSAYNPVASTASFTQLTAPTGMTVTATGTFNALIRGSKVLDKYGEDFIITVRTGGAPATARVDIASATGLWSATNIATTNNAGDYVITSAEFAGLTLTIDTGAAGDLVVGQVFTVRQIGAYARLGATQLVTGDLGAGFTGARDTTYLVTVTAGTASGVTGAVVSVVDTTGLDTTQTGVTVTDDTFFNVGSFGLRMKFVVASFPTQGGLRAGDVYFVNAVAASQSSTVFDKVVLDGPAVDTTLFASTATALVSVAFRLAYTGLTSTGWTAGAGSVIVASALSLTVAARSSGNTACPFVNAVGKLSLSYRALVPRAAGGDRIYIETPADIVSNFGPIDLANDLAFGLNEMLGGSQGRGIYGLAVTGLSDEAVAADLSLLESTDEVYALAVLTTRLDVMLTAKAHALAMSQKDVKNFRKIYIGTDSPGTYAVLNKKPDNITNYTATISNSGGLNVLVSTADDVDFRVLGLVVGDRFLLPNSATEYVIASVVSATEILLVAGPVNPVSPAVPFQLWKADTVASQKSFLNQRAAALGTELVAHIWTEKGTRFINETPTVVPNRFLACELAGIRSALLPQQGLTRTEVAGVTAAPNMYLRYRRGDLDNIAANGTFIVTQDAANGPIFVRHQVTTETGKGSLYYEDSATVIMHAVNFSTKDIIDPLIGKYNATQETVDLVNDRISAMLRDKSSIVVKDIGPTIIGFRNLVVKLHPILKDRIIVNGIITVPLPLNNIDVVWDGEVSLSA